jgi:C4-type Zn-finger protein
MHNDHERPRNVFYHQGCPVCGRTLEINVNLLGRRVYCQHCGGGFVAMDASMGGFETTNREGAVDRVDALLERAAMMLGQATAAR